MSSGAQAHTTWRKHHLPQPWAGPGSQSHPHRGAPLQKGAPLPRTPRSSLPPRPRLPAVAAFLPALLQQMNKNKSLCGPRKSLGERIEAEGKRGRL